MADVSKQVNLSVGTHFYTLLGVANGKCKTLRDSETSVFLCEAETFCGLWTARPRFRPHIGFAINSRLQDVQNHAKSEKSRQRDP